MKAVVTGMIATYQVGGVVWDYAQYVLALERLGFEVYYLEDTGWEAYDPVEGCYKPDISQGAQYVAAELVRLSPAMDDRWHVRGMDGQDFGMTREDLAEVVADADVFLNVSGAALLRDEYLRCRRTVLIDTDPGWNHFRNYPRWDAGHGWGDAHSWREHTWFFTYAEGIDRPGCALPALGVPWAATRPPVVIDLWSARPTADAAWTTVMTWDNFREPIMGNGRAYGSKELEFPRIVGLPSVLSVPLEVAVGGDSAPVGQWETAGWRVRPGYTVSDSADRYRRYVEGSRGELSVAKNVYVDTGSGWFSCRSVCYLAAGLPVVVQDTGFSDWLPCGKGLHAFRDGDGAAAAIRDVERDYDEHAAAALEIAREHFRAEDVVGQLLTRIGVG